MWRQVEGGTQATVLQGGPLKTGGKRSAGSNRSRWSVGFQKVESIRVEYFQQEGSGFRARNSEMGVVAVVAGLDEFLEDQGREEIVASHVAGWLAGIGIRVGGGIDPCFPVLPVGANMEAEFRWVGLQMKTVGEETVCGDRLRFGGDFWSVVLQGMDPEVDISCFAVEVVRGEQGLALKQEGRGMLALVSYGAGAFCVKLDVRRFQEELKVRLVVPTIGSRNNALEMDNLRDRRIDHRRDDAFGGKDFLSAGESFLGEIPLPFVAEEGIS